jgi:hypothetical protein
MSTRTDCRRGPARHPIPRSDDRYIEFDHPRPGGRSYRFPLHDISESGISFMLTEELPMADEGTSLDKVTVHVGNCVIHGDLLVMHVTPEMTPGSICGALFYPDSDNDLVKMKSLIAGLEVMIAD